MEKQENVIVLHDGGITIPVPPKTPIVLTIPEEDSCEGLAALIVNLLRCGCPTVQLIGSSGKWKDASSDVIDRVKQLKLEGEEFICSPNNLGLPIMKVILTDY